MGSLYVGNPTSALAAYQVNGLAIAPGRPFAPGPKPPPYTPYFVFVVIEPDLGPGVVGYGDNTLDVSFSDTVKPHDDYAFGFTVQRGTWSVDDDLIAYVYRGLLMLMTPRGVPLPPNPLLIQAEPALPEPAALSTLGVT